MRKILNCLLFRCACGVFVGVAAMTAFVALLLFYGETQEPVVRTTSQILRFPENEQMLDDLSVQLAREGEALSSIAPAAGNTPPSPEGSLEN